jgi:hypothetical protein
MSDLPFPSLSPSPSPFGEGRGPQDARLPAIAAAERERLIEQLAEAFAHDVIPLEEFERRVELAYRAPSQTELMALAADLPAVVADQPTGVNAPATARRIAVVLGNVEQSNSGIIPTRLELRAVAGNLELDLTGARLAPGVTEISIRAFMGNVQIQLPAGAEVENLGTGFLGSFECHGLPGQGARSPGHTGVVRLTGRAVLSSVEVLFAG